MSIGFLSQRASVVASVLSVSLLTACSTQLTEGEQFAIEYEVAERQQAIREFLHSCERGGHAVVYTGPSYHKLRNPVKRIPSHARLSEYECVSRQRISRELGVGG